MRQDARFSYFLLLYFFIFIFIIYFYFITRGNPVSKSLFHKASKGLFHAKTLPIFVAGQPLWHQDPEESKTPLQATGYQTCSAAEQRGI